MPPVSGIAAPVNGQLQEIFLKKLESSTLTEEDLGTLKFKLFERGPEELPIPGPGFVIPYHDIHAEPTGFFRYRYLVDVRSRGKLVRYTQPPGSPVRAYYPPMVDWAAIAQHREEDILITEGELKAAAACKLGYPTVGLGGVWSWRQGPKLIHLFDDIQWAGRKVHLIFDSDAMNNLQVLQAEQALAKVLSAAGALVRIVRIPAIPALGKTGLDDLIHHRGPDALVSAIVNTGYWFDECIELHKFNEQFCYVKKPGVVVERSNLHLMDAVKFHSQIYKNCHYLVDRVKNSNKKVSQEKVFTAVEWLAWPNRSQADELAYEPGRYDTVLQDAESKTLFNIWPGWGVDAVPGDVSPWTRLLDFLFDAPGGGAARRWFEQWCAYPLQHPGTKLFQASLLWGVTQGTGKSLVGETLNKIYGKNGTQMQHGDLQDSFNDWAVHKQFVLAEEATGGDRYAKADRIKNMVTQEKIKINQKYIASYTLRDCINYLFTSNRPDALLLEDTDRRFFVWEISRAPMAPEFYAAYREWKEGPGPAYLFHHLLHLDLTGFSPREHALPTHAKAEMSRMAKSDVDGWAATLRDNPGNALLVGSRPTHWTVATTEDLIALYDPEKNGRVTSNGLGRSMRRQGLRQIQAGAQFPMPDGRKLRMWILGPCPLGKPWDLLSQHEVLSVYASEHNITLPKKERY